MARPKYLLIPLLLTLSSFGPFDPIGTNQVSLNTSIIGLFDDSGYENITVSVTNKKSSINQLNLIISYEQPNSTTSLLYTSQLRSYNPGETKSYSFDIDHKYLPNTMNYLIYIRNQGNTDIMKISQRITSGNKIDKVITDSQNTFYSNPYAFSISNNRKKIIKDEFQFNNIPNTLYQDKYLYLDLNNIYFSYKGFGELFYNEISLSFIDEKDLFPLCHINSFKEVRIPLKLVNSGIHYYLFFQNDMFVNPNLLTMSFFKREGFVKTRKFYLPHNMSNVIQGYKFKLNFNGLGLTQSNFVKELDYVNDHNYVGNCHNSDYCVISGVDNG